MAPLPLFVGVCNSSSEDVVGFLREEGDANAPLLVVDLDSGKVLHGGSVGFVHAHLRGVGDPSEPDEVSARSTRGSTRGTEGCTQ